MESFVLDRLKKEIKLSERQYGGVKGVGTEHFLLDTWESVMVALEEEGSAASLVCIDFEKAFNRVDHNECVKALDEMGASGLSVDWVSAFLHGRKMSVRLREALSTPRDVPGGSPQGSILGNFLFCATTDRFSQLADEQNVGVTLSFEENGVDVTADDNEDTVQLTSTPARPGTIGDRLGVGSEDEEEEDFVFFGTRRNIILSSSSEDSIGVLPSNTTIERYLGIGQGRVMPVINYVYIDDYNAVERIWTRNAVSHISTQMRRIHAHAPKSESLFHRVKEVASSINMRVNAKKTQLLCIHPYSSDQVNSYVRADGDNIVSNDELKILGFYFNHKPNATYHVSLLLQKFYNMLWSLRFLRRSGMRPEDMCRVYCTIIRPVVEYAAVVYHSLIPKYQAEPVSYTHLTLPTNR